MNVPVATSARIKDGPAVHPVTGPSGRSPRSTTRSYSDSLRRLLDRIAGAVRAAHRATVPF